ncbi:MAG TPA: sensor histidine kinase [Gaiellaceae bacterium]|nr:sensor histidine kinase [Gaiellaceae bacterium]
MMGTTVTTDSQAERGGPRSSRLLAPLLRPSTYRAILFFLGELALSILGLIVIPVSWALIIVFAITPLSVPLLIGFRALIGGLAQAQGKLAELIGIQVSPPVLSRGETSFWGRGKAVLVDRSFWRQQLYTLAMFPVALVPLCVLTTALEAAGVPLYYHWDQVDTIFSWDVNAFGEALLVVPVGLALFVAGLYVTAALTPVSRRLASRMLSGEGPVMSAPEVRDVRLRSLRINAAVTGFVDLLLIAIWALTGGGTFWPIWAILALALLLAIHAWIVLVLEYPQEVKSQPLAIQVGISVAIVLFLVAIWAVSGRGYFWPVWPFLGLGFVAALHGVFSSHWSGKRIEKLETSRAGAVESQEAELRRIERDLHDGAQARLVAVGMSLGMAEQKLESDPEAVRELLAEARHGATEALEELRDLARGIHPPILTDRGLEAAIAALVTRSPIPVTLDVDVPTRPSAPIETAAYFTVSEALANAIKHSHASTVDIRIRVAHNVLAAEISDDGRGGADADGNGLKGLRQRIEALDGTLRVTSPQGGPTTVRAVLPCGS